MRHSTRSSSATSSVPTIDRVPSTRIVSRFQTTRTALIEENRGCAVLNDCKYGVNVVGDTIKLTLLKSALALTCISTRRADLYLCPLCLARSVRRFRRRSRGRHELNAPLIWWCRATEAHSRCSPSMPPNVILETVKPAEDGSADVVLRLYEAKRAAVRCSLTTTLPIVSACTVDMLETVVHEELPVADGTISLDSVPSAKTVRLARLVGFPGRPGRTGAGPSSNGGAMDSKERAYGVRWRTSPSIVSRLASSRSISTRWSAVHSGPRDAFARRRSRRSPFGRGVEMRWCRVGERTPPRSTESWISSWTSSMSVRWPAVWPHSMGLRTGEGPSH